MGSSNSFSLLAAFCLLFLYTEATLAEAAQEPWQRRAVLDRRAPPSSTSAFTGAPTTLATPPTSGQPISVTPSQYWEGNDGLWSTFSLQIGVAPQVVRVLPSTAESNSWVVGPDGCPSSFPLDCPAMRGGTFNSNLSMTWVPEPTFNLSMSNSPGNEHPQTGRFGYDQVTIGGQGAGGPPNSHAIVASYSDPNYFLGILGLKAGPSNLTNLNSLRSQNSIPSTTYGYTAGAHYRLKQVVGSLTLGGYDASRFTPSNVTFPLFSNAPRDLMVNVQNIDLSTNGTSVGTYSTPFSAAIDSTAPYLNLPMDACTKFESAFGLNWNDTLQLYIVNSTLHTKLVQNNPSVTLTIGPAPAGGQTVEITLPYGAFDLNVSYPITAVGDSQYYFPLRRGADPTQFSLGRTFLQEAYIIADYDRQNFTVSPCTWVGNVTTQSIHTIVNPVDAAAIAARTSSRFSKVAIAGVIIGGIVVLIAVTIVTWLCIRRSRRRKAAGHAEPKLDSDTSDAPITRPYTSQSHAERPYTSQSHNARPYASYDSGRGEGLAGNLGVHEMAHDYAAAPEYGASELDSPHPADYKSAAYTDGEKKRGPAWGHFEMAGDMPMYELDGGAARSELAAYEKSPTKGGGRT